MRSAFVVQFTQRLREKRRIAKPILDWNGPFSEPLSEGFRSSWKF